MRVFITGSSGLLGSHIIRQSREHHIIAGSVHKIRVVPNENCLYYDLDITSKSQCLKAFKTFNPDVVIHTAAIATPDYCDKHQDEATKVNITGTKNIIAACKATSAKLVFITTNGVYDGEHAPYDEASQIEPIDHYGHTKYKGELLVKESGLDHIIIRCNTMYGWNNLQERENPLTWQIRILGRNKTPLNMVDDMFNNFLYAHEAAEAIWNAIDCNVNNQTINVAGKDCISRYDFSVKIAKQFDMDSDMITPVKLSFFGNMVPRPKNTCFVTNKMTKLLSQKPLTVAQGLKHAKNHTLSHANWKEV